MDMFWVGVFIWFALSLPNAFIFVWGKNRLADAYGNEPTPLDGFDICMALLLSPMGPLGPIIGFLMTDWWCSGFEGDRSASNDPQVMPRERRLALKRAGWSKAEIAEIAEIIRPEAAE